VIPLKTPHVVHVVRSLAPTATLRQVEGVQSFADPTQRHSIVTRGRGLPPLAAFRAMREIGGLRPDVVHLWDDWALQEVGPLLAVRSSTTPIVVSLRHPRTPGTWLASRLERHVLAKAARIVIGDEAVLLGRTAGRIAASDRRTATIADGIARPTVDEVARLRSEVRSELALPAATRLIGYAGPLVHHANVRDVIWLGMLLRVLHPDVRVVIVGEGPHEDDLRRFATLVEYAEQTHFLGWRRDETRILGACDLYVDAARLDGPSPAIDAAQAAGVPVLCVDTPIRSRQVQADRTGFLFAEHDRAMLVRRAHKLLTNPDLYREMSAAARTWSERLPTPESAAAAYHELYRTTK
jgi:glycosyltransferase involved in cell wall biosynthesis